MPMPMPVHTQLGLVQRLGGDGGKGGVEGRFRPVCYLEVLQSCCTVATQSICLTEKTCVGANIQRRKTAISESHLLLILDGRSCRITHHWSAYKWFMYAQVRSLARCKYIRHISMYAIVGPNGSNFAEASVDT